MPHSGRRPAFRLRMKELVRLVAAADVGGRESLLPQESWSPGNLAVLPGSRRRSADRGGARPAESEDRPPECSRRRGCSLRRILATYERPTATVAASAGAARTASTSTWGCSPRNMPPATNPAMLIGSLAEPYCGEYANSISSRSKTVMPAWIATASTSIRLSTPAPPTACAPSSFPVSGWKRIFSVIGSAPG